MDNRKMKSWKLFVIYLRSIRTTTSTPTMTMITINRTNISIGEIPSEPPLLFPFPFPLALIVTLAVSLSVAPLESVTVKVAVYVPFFLLTFGVY